MTIGERVKELRKARGLTMEQFGDKIRASKQTISNIENDNRVPSGQMVLAICREFRINEPWLRDGVGEMEKQTDDIFSEAVADMILEDNPFYDLIKGIVETYAELDPASKQVIQRSCDKLLENLKKKREEETSSQA